MSEERRVSREGIHIDRAVADAVAIEEDLDSNIVGPYRFPDPVRRRISGWIYLVLTVLVGALIHPIPAILPLLVAAWHFLAAWPLKVEQEEAVTRAGTAVDFPIGHASAALTFHGWRAHPRWSVIIYSAAEPPDQRALVTVDAVSGDLVGETYTEEL
ncbi:MAG TPA: hypothetical protein VK070_08195 [Acidimicrobiia bacterium]|jgi:hypothetical protein|nr:hypothetical protein [Acidimicrobiia bacterium]